MFGRTLSIWEHLCFSFQCLLPIFSSVNFNNSFNNWIIKTMIPEQHKNKDLLLQVLSHISLTCYLNHAMLNHDDTIPQNGRHTVSKQPVN